jgi:predicted amidohydrolase
MTASQTAPETVSLTLWAASLSQPLSGPADWLNRLSLAAREAKEAGSAMLVAPEYICEHWLTYAGPDLPEADEPACMAEQGAALAPQIRFLAERTGIDILAGTWPVPDGAGGYHNAGHLFFADGRAPLVQTKLCLTPGEKDPAGWAIKPGRTLQIFRWQGLTCAMVICLDIELPALSARLAQEVPGLDLILCPSMTERASGYARVFGCAKARAVELMCAVAAVGTIGNTPLSPARPNTSGAAVFLPCEAALGHDGRFAEIGPFDDAPAGDPFGPRLHVADIPVGRIRQLRAAGPEVWPGAWTGTDVAITEFRGEEQEEKAS